LIDEARELAKAMRKIYGDDAEREAREYALMLKEGGRRDYAVWIEAADIIARRR
jgi:hypothetical protein